ncbi:MAG: hypothetical protein WKF40_07050 [Thermoleophilaceae bacterium]
MSATTSSAAKAPAPAISSSGSFGRGQQGPGRHPEDGQRHDDPVGQHAVLEVDGGQGHERRRERQDTDQVGVDAAHGGHRGEDRRGQQLEQRIPGRDRLTAMPAAPAQQQPREHRDVVARGDRRAAAGAARRRARRSTRAAGR